MKAFFGVQMSPGSAAYTRLMLMKAISVAPFEWEACRPGRNEQRRLLVGWYWRKSRSGVHSHPSVTLGTREWLRHENEDRLCRETRIAGFSG